MKAVRGLLLLGLIWALAACQSLPYASEGELPPPVVVADGSAERTALNAKVYDAATGWIERHYYARDFNGHDWPAMRQAGRAEAVAQPSEETFYARLAAVIDELDDRHTSVTSPTNRALEEAIRLGQSGVSVGFSAVRRGDRYFVTRVRPDGPAAPEGVQIGWRLVSVNGNTNPVAFQVTEGQSASYVFEDEHGVEQRRTITAVVLPSRERRDATRREDGVLVLRFEAFDSLTHTWFQEQMDAAIADPPRGIVIDVRDNGGGFAAVLGDMTARLYGDPQVFMVMDGRFVDLKLKSVRADSHWDGPVAIMIGAGSGSASEVFAALLQETGRGPVIGETSAGAVIASRQVNLPDGGEMNLSLHMVLTGHQRRVLEGVGVTPDILVEPPLADLRAGRDVALERAAAELLSR